VLHLFIYRIFLLFIIILTSFNLSNLASAETLADGNYTGAYRVTKVHAHNKDSKVGDTGVFEFIIKDNKIIKIFDYDDADFNKAKTRYKFSIDPETGVVDGYARQLRNFNNPPITLNIYLKGKFIGKRFAGEATVNVTRPINFIAEKLVFESIE